MRTIAITIALAAITILGVSATVSAGSKSAAAQDGRTCATMSANDCAMCPNGGSCPPSGTCPAGSGGCGSCPKGMAQHTR